MWKNLSLKWIKFTSICYLMFDLSIYQYHYCTVMLDYYCSLYHIFLIKQWNFGYLDEYFTPVACFLLMNTSDYIGRASVTKMTLVLFLKLNSVNPCFNVKTFSHCLKPKHPRFWTCALSILRIGFFPLIMLSNAQPRQYLPVLIQSDAGFIAIVAFFGLSNGYISNVCFSIAPK